MYDNILRVENKAKRFYRDLSKDLMGAGTNIHRHDADADVAQCFVTADGPSVLLRVVPRFGPIVRVDRKRPRSPAMKEALSNADDSGMLTLVRKTQIADYYAHNVCQLVVVCTSQLTWLIRTGQSSTQRCKVC